MHRGGTPYNSEMETVGRFAIFKENLPALREKPPKAGKGELPTLLTALSEPATRTPSALASPASTRSCNARRRVRSR